jgi:y4mF family transcriptional regulator
MRVETINDLSSALRARRLALGMTQADLAASAGVSRQWLNELERGKATASLDLVLAVLEALGLVLHVGADADVSARDEPTADLDALLDEYRASR